MANLSYRVIANYDWRIQSGQDTKAIIIGKAVIAGISTGIEKENSDPVDGTLLQTHFLTDKDHADALRDIIRATYGIYGAKADIVVIPPPLSMNSMMAFNQPGSGLQTTLLSAFQYVVQCWGWENGAVSFVRGFLRDTSVIDYGKDPAGNCFASNIVAYPNNGAYYPILTFDNSNQTDDLTIPDGDLKLGNGTTLYQLHTLNPIVVPKAPQSQTNRLVAYVDTDGNLYPQRVEDGSQGGISVLGPFTYPQAVQVGRL